MRTFSIFLFGRLTAWREWRYAKRSGQTALVLYRRLRVEQPELSGKELYEAFVCRRNGIGSSDARTILPRAETSFAAWPNENCLLRIRWASSMPANVMAALPKDLKPPIEAHRRLIAR